MFQVMAESHGSHQVGFLVSCDLCAGMILNARSYVTIWRVLIACPKIRFTLLPPLHTYWAYFYSQNDYLPFLPINSVELRLRISNVW